MTATDELHADLRELVETMNRLSLIPADFEEKEKVTNWLNTLNAMQASDELSETQVRQMLFDLDTAYAAFQNLLHAT